MLVVMHQFIIFPYFIVLYTCLQPSNGSVCGNSPVQINPNLCMRNASLAQWDGHRLHNVRDLGSTMTGKAVFFTQPVQARDAGRATTRWAPEVRCTEVIPCSSYAEKKMKAVILKKKKTCA